MPLFDSENTTEQNARAIAAERAGSNQAASSLPMSDDTTAQKQQQSESPRNSEPVTRETPELGRSSDELASSRELGKSHESTGPNGSNGSNRSHGSSESNGSYGSGHSSLEPTPDQNTEIGFLPVLKNLNFLALWCGQVFSQLADKIYLVLMIAIIASRFQSANQSISAWVSALMIVFTIPAVLFGFAAGVFVDRWPKKSVLVLTNLLRGGFVFGLPVLLWISADWQPFYSIPIGFLLLLCVTFLVSTLTQFFAPAEQAAIPLLVEKKHLLSANSLYTTTMMASVIIGFALGEPGLELAENLMQTINSQLGLNLDSGKEIFVGLCYAIAGLVLLLIRPHGQTDIPEQPDSHLWADMKDDFITCESMTRSGQP